LTKEIEGKLIAALVYLESGNYQGVKEQIEEVVELFEIDRLKKSKEDKTVVRRPKRGDRKAAKSKK